MFTINEIAAATGGRIIGRATAEVSGVSTDSRTVTPGQLFVPLKGEQFDGHDFLTVVAERGISAVLAEEQWLKKNTPSPLTGEGRGGGDVAVAFTDANFTHPLAPLGPQFGSSRQGRGGESNDAEQYLLSRLLDPTPRTLAGRMLAESGLVSAMIDISDGLLADFGHIAELSGVGGTLHLDALPTSGAFRAATRGLPAFPHQLALAGGEDYELCFTALPGHREKIAQIMKTCGIEATPVGIVTTLSGVKVLQSDGTPYNLQTPGFNHFI